MVASVIWQRRGSASTGAVRRAIGPRCFLVAVGAIVVMASAAAGVARAASVEPSRVRVSAALVDDVVRRLLPLDVVLPGPAGGGPDAGVTPALPGTITELRYCGASDKGTGRFRAVLRWGGAAGAPPPVLSADGACRQTLGDLAKQLPAGAPDQGSVVADLEAMWRPWELRLGVVRTAAPTPPRPGGPGGARPLVGWDGRHDLLAISTSGLRVLTDIAEPVIVHVMPSFVADAVEIVAVFGDGAPGAPPPRGAPLSMAAPANVAGELPLAWGNQVLRQLTGAQPLAVPVDRDVIDVQNVLLAPGMGGGGFGGLTVTGTATPRSLRETARLTIQVGGAEARVLSVRAEPQLENCSGLGVMASVACNARNAARGAAAAAFGAALTQKYQGQALRDLAGPQVFRFDVGARRFELRGDLAHVVAAGRGLAFGARLSPDDAGASAR